MQATRHAACGRPAAGSHRACARGRDWPVPGDERWAAQSRTGVGPVPGQWPTEHRRRTPAPLFRPSPAFPPFPFFKCSPRQSSSTPPPPSPGITARAIDADPAPSSNPHGPAPSRARLSLAAAPRREHGRRPLPPSAAGATNVMPSWCSPPSPSCASLEDVLIGLSPSDAFPVRDPQATICSRTLHPSHHPESSLLPPRGPTRAASSYNARALLLAAAVPLFFSLLSSVP
jgi:hypothetical protein